MILIWMNRWIGIIILACFLLLVLFLTRRLIFDIFHIFNTHSDGIIGYLKVLLSWPLIVFALLLIYRKPITRFLVNSRVSDTNQYLAPFEAQSKSTQGIDEKILNDEELASTNSNDLSTEHKQIITSLIEENEFLYLSHFLVHNSKWALAWFWSMPYPKETFFSVFRLSSGSDLPLQEKENIFNALLSLGLIVFDQGIYIASEKGKKFLDFLEKNPILKK